MPQAVFDISSENQGVCCRHTDPNKYPIFIEVWGGGGPYQYAELMLAAVPGIDIVHLPPGL